MGAQGMNVLDLFCGASGGWSLGLHRAGITV
jgi:site-specific DNA-cytosine methylase